VGRRLLITSDPDGREGKWEVAYKRSADGGDTWGPERWLTPGVDLFRLGTAVCLRAGAVLGSTLHVVWGSKTLVTPTPAGIHTWGKICYQRSTDGGATWGEPRRITAVNAPNGWATHAKICASGATVQLAWTVAPDGQDQPRAAFYLNSPDGGLSWGAPERLTSATDGECWVEAVGGTESYAVVLIRKDDKLYWRRRDLDADEGGRR
jgi:Neuraminidase (sialidase)